MSERGADGVKGAIGPRAMCAGPTGCTWPVPAGARFCGPHGGVTSTVADDRVTLPLTKTRAAAEKMCAAVCTDPWTGEVLPSGHDPACLTLLLAERDLAMATTYLATSISQCCLVGTHSLCEDCACHHHQLKTGRMRK